MCLYADGPHPGPTPPVGDAKGFVEVEVAYVSTDVAGASQTDLGTGQQGIDQHQGWLVGWWFEGWWIGWLGWVGWLVGWKDGLLGSLYMCEESLCRHRF